MRGLAGSGDERRLKHLRCLTGHTGAAYDKRRSLKLEDSDVMDCVRALGRTCSAPHDRSVHAREGPVWRISDIGEIENECAEALALISRRCTTVSLTEGERDGTRP